MPPIPPRLEPNGVLVDGPTVRITNLLGEPDVVLEFKSEDSAEAACRSIHNYIDVVDVERTDESVMHMLEVVLGRQTSYDE